MTDQRKERGKVSPAPPRISATRVAREAERSALGAMPPRFLPL
ncbi:MAG: hypothetical protein ABSE08_19840 [Syntrophobacteraceae bacterium]